MTNVLPDDVYALLGHPMSEDALDAAVVAEVALGGDDAASLVGPIRTRVVVYRGRAQDVVQEMERN